MRAGPLSSHDGAELHGAPGHLGAGPAPRALTERAVPAARPHSRCPAAAGPWTRPPGPAASSNSRPPLRRRVAARSSASVPAAAAAFGAQRPQEMVAERLAYSRGGRAAADREAER